MMSQKLKQLGREMDAADCLVKAAMAELNAGISLGSAKQTEEARVKVLAAYEAYVDRHIAACEQMKKELWA